MFEDFLNHKCNIYHTEDDVVNIGYGIMAAGKKKFGNTVSLSEIPCHFHVRLNSGIRLVQKEPYTALEGDVKLSLQAGTDIRINDIVEDCRDGMKYRAGKPAEVYGGHHIIVMLSRLEGVKGAI